MLMGLDGSRAGAELWGWGVGESCRAPCRGPAGSWALQTARAGSCPSFFSEVQSGLWDLCWYPLKANVRSGVGIKIYADFPLRFAC